MTLDRREVARYLGARGTALDEQVSALVDACEQELTGAVTPRSCSRRLRLDQVDWRENSRDLAKHLSHCEEVILFALTLGAEADRLLRRWGAQSMAKAAVGQACCAVWLDDLCSDLCREFGRELPKGRYLTPAFSPGYGDWDLSAQQGVLDLLSAHKRIGLTLTKGGMLVPEKSITAVVGLSDRVEEACGQKCGRCKKKDCAFRAG